MKEQIGIFRTKLEHSGFLHEAVEVGHQVIPVVAVDEAFATVVHKPAEHVSPPHTVCPVVLLHAPAGRGHPKEGHNLAKGQGDTGHPAQYCCQSGEMGLPPAGSGNYHKTQLILQFCDLMGLFWGVPGTSQTCPKAESWAALRTELIWKEQ